MYKLADILRELDFDEVKILRALEELANRYEYAPVDEISNKSTLEVDDVIFRLGRLNKVRLVQRSAKPYLGYRLTRSGYDASALHELASRDIIVSIGQPYGVGKESRVYRALDAEGHEVAVKLLRWGHPSFRQVRRLRSVDDISFRSWMEYCRQAAAREYKALRMLKDVNGRVPKPIALNRHVIVMSCMEGNLLLHINKLTNPTQVLDRIIQQICLAFKVAHIVHGDLSEYNIFVSEDEQVTLFDWPQWQPIDHPNIQWLLKRDVSNVLKFFKRRFRIFTDLKQTLGQIMNDVDEEA
ncbi:MAG: RIO1 family regulatory kinase/ATPase [Promethearchaeota archaeon]